MNIIFGCGFGGTEFFKKCNIKIDYFTDNDKRLWGNKFNGIEVIPPTKLKKLKIKKIIIAVPAIDSIKEQLKDYKIGKKKILISKYLAENQIPKLKKNILITARGKNGGIYFYNAQKKKFKKVFKGSIRGIIKIKRDYFCLDEIKGLLKLNNNFKVSKAVKIGELTNPHSISFDRRRKKFFILLTADDSILQASYPSLEIEKKFNYKKNNIEIDHHHINSITYHDKNLYMTMFSHGKNWRETLRPDGAIIKVISFEKKRFKIIKKKLNQPHSILNYNNDFYYCNSQNFEVLNLKKNLVLKLNGYTRGLLVDKDFVLVGISQVRRFDNFTKNQIMTLDSGFHIISKKFKTQMFVKLPTIDVFDIIFA